jgi:hypothetical protein
MLSPEDYYIENGYYVFTEEYHLKRGYCCKSGCRHCPWKYRKQDQNAEDETEGKMRQGTDPDIVE